MHESLSLLLIVIFLEEIYVLSFEVTILRWDNKGMTHNANSNRSNQLKQCLIVFYN